MRLLTLVAALVIATPVYACGGGGGYTESGDSETSSSLPAPEAN